MPRTIDQMFAANRRRGASTGVGTAYWPYGVYWGSQLQIDLEAEVLSGQAFDAGDEVAFVVGGRISEDGQEIVITRGT